LAAPASGVRVPGPLAVAAGEPWRAVLTVYPAGRELLSRLPGGRDNDRVVKAWGRRERAHVANSLLAIALVEIRFLASHPESAEHPDGALAQIGMIADACHNLPGAGVIRPRPGDDVDPFVWLWQTATAAQRRWLTRQFEALGVDYRYLADSAPWPPAHAPARRPGLRRRGGRVPRTLGEFVALDTASLRALVLEAAALEPPGRKPPGYVLAHLDPGGRHLVRASRAGEELFLPPGPGDLRQYRGLLQMIDSSVVVGHLRLRTSSFAALPANMRVAERLLLAATVPQSHERDVYLWTRGHRGACPRCPLCPASLGPTASSEA
jgi:hypothetical protein